MLIWIVELAVAGRSSALLNWAPCRADLPSQLPPQSAEGVLPPQPWAPAGGEERRGRGRGRPPGRSRGVRHEGGLASPRRPGPGRGHRGPQAWTPAGGISSSCVESATCVSVGGRVGCTRQCSALHTIAPCLSVWDGVGHLSVCLWIVCFQETIKLATAQALRRGAGAAGGEAAPAGPAAEAAAAGPSGCALPFDFPLSFCSVLPCFVKAPSPHFPPCCRMSTLAPRELQDMFDTAFSWFYVQLREAATG